MIPDRNTNQHTADKLRLLQALIYFQYLTYFSRNISSKLLTNSNRNTAVLFTLQSLWSLWEDGKIVKLFSLFLFLSIRNSSVAWPASVLSTLDRNSFSALPFTFSFLSACVYPEQYLSVSFRLCVETLVNILPFLSFSNKKQSPVEKNRKEDYEIQ